MARHPQGDVSHSECGSPTLGCWVLLAQAVPGVEVAGAFGHRPPHSLRTSLEHLSHRREELGTVVICSLWRGVE